MCTLEKRGRVFVLTLTGDDEHRLSPTLIASIQAALHQAKSEACQGSALVTTAHGKFFSNGFDLAWARSSSPAPGPDGSASGFRDRLHQMVISFEQQVMAELLSLPMPTVAAVTGHAAAAGLATALCHDYVHMRGDRGVLYMSELDIGLPFPESFVGLLRAKLPGPAARRAVAMRASKIRAEEAVQMGIVDEAHEGPEETLVAAVRTAEELAAKNWDGEIYANIRKAMFREAAEALGIAGQPSRL